MPVTRVNIAQAKAHFSRLVRKAMSGEEVVIARDNKPLLKLVPFATSRQKRVPAPRRAPAMSVTSLARLSS